MKRVVSSDVLKSLAKWDTPTICNAIELFEIRARNQGYMNSTIRACFPELPPMVGFALTSTFRSHAPPRSGSSYAGMEGQLAVFDSLGGPPVVVFQDLDTPSAAATFGEVMCTTYQQFGAAGLITSGAGRDLDQVRSLRFPAFTSGTCCAHGYCHILEVGCPVSVGGVTVSHGELIHGDCNGVTTIPIEIASEIPDVCRELMDAEKIVLDYVRSADKTPAGFGQARAAMAAGFEKIRARVRRTH
ncbi:MAG: RraA family protein [Planctomyces sp.]|nr:RraA family protein [Planctomyces sp.]